jgi:hypothetical protein
MPWVLTSNAPGKVGCPFRGGTAGQAGLFFLPPYSPQLNPDELVGNDLNPRHRAKADHLADAAAADDRLPYAAAAEAARSGPQLLPHPDHALRTRLTGNYYGIVNMSISLVGVRVGELGHARNRRVQDLQYVADVRSE